MTQRATLMFTAVLFGCGSSANLSEVPLTAADCEDNNPCTITAVGEDGECTSASVQDGLIECIDRDSLGSCTDGEYEALWGPDLLAAFRANDRQIYGYTGCSPRDDGSIELLLRDRDQSYPTPVCEVGERGCFPTFDRGEFFQICSLFELTNGALSEPLWDMYACEQRCIDSGGSGTVGCNSDLTDCACF